MGLSEPLRASAQHIELLQHKRRRLSDALVSAELRFLGSGPNFGLWGNLWGPVTYCDHCWSADSPVLVSRG